MTAALDAKQSDSLTPVLPGTRASWPEINTGAGFSNSERVDLAAAWFETRSESNVWNVGDRALVRTAGPDGHTWIDPATGEVVDAERPQSEILACNKTTGRPVVFDRDHGTGRVGWVDLETNLLVDSSNVTTHLADEKQAAPIDYTFSITPGTVRIQISDPRLSEPDPSEVPQWIVDSDGNKTMADGTPVEDSGGARSSIREFSRKSKLNLICRVLATPWADYLHADERLWFVTLTAPSEWRRWLGDHDQSERAMKRFADRVADHTGNPARFFWKREFQRRGAPHWHLIMIAPMAVNGEPLRHFVSEQWFQAVASGEEKHLLAGTNVDLGSSVKAVDPKRLALYFAGYSTGKDKDYQHVLPYGYESPETGTTGRWWGAKGLPKKEATVRVTLDDVVTIQRLLRARERSQRGEIEPGRTRMRQPLTKKVVVRRWSFRKLGGTARTSEGPPEPVWRRVRRRTRQRSLKGVDRGCTSFVNDGPALAVQIARVLARTIIQHPKGTRRPLP